MSELIWLRLELLVSEKLHRRIYRECGGSYAQIARKLYLDNGKLVRFPSQAIIFAVVFCAS